MMYPRGQDLIQLASFLVDATNTAFYCSASYNEDIYNVTKLSIFYLFFINKCCSIELSMNQMALKNKNIKQHSYFFTKITIRNVS